MADEREKFVDKAEDGDEVEGHKFDPAEAKHDKFESGEGDDVEAHKFEPAADKFNTSDGDGDLDKHKV
jgi:hypothetical protein